MELLGERGSRQARDALACQELSLPYVANEPLIKGHWAPSEQMVMASRGGLGVLNAINEREIYANPLLCGTKCVEIRSKASLAAVKCLTLAFNPS